MPIIYEPTPEEIAAYPAVTILQDLETIGVVSGYLYGVGGSPLTEPAGFLEGMVFRAPSEVIAALPAGSYRDATAEEIAAAGGYNIVAWGLAE